MPIALAPAPLSSSAGFPALARLVDRGRALRSRYRRVKIFRAVVFARQQLRRAGATGAGRAETLAALATRLVAIDDQTVELIGVAPRGPCVVLAAIEPTQVLAVLAQVPAAAVVSTRLVPGSIAAALGVRVVDDANPAAAHQAVSHAVAALRAGVPVVITTTTAGCAEVLGLASLIGVPVVPAAVLGAPTARRLDVVVRAAIHPLPGEVTHEFMARVQRELRLGW